MRRFKLLSYMRPGQRWICRHCGEPVHLEHNDQTKCSVHEGPCVPRMNIRTQRAFFISALSIFFIGLWLISTQHTGFKVYAYNPGEVTNPHSTFEKNCMQCHGDNKNVEIAHAGVVDWSDAKVDSANCLNCHGLGDHPFSPHNMNDGELIELTGKYDDSHNGRYRKMNCTDCHKEHHGREANIAKLSDKQCQTCHQNQFKSFENGHPEFKNFPYKRKTHLVFDHSSHMGKHFKKSDSQFACLNCHTPTGQGSQMTFKGFEKTCMSCHGDQVYGDDKSDKGIVLLNLPLIDLDTLKDNGHKVGSWPEDSDGEISPWFLYVLGLKPDNQKFIDFILENDLDDLSEAQESDLKLMEDFVWELKSTLYKIATDEENHLFEILENTKNSKDRNRLSHMIAPLNPIVVKSAIANWFPRLRQEMALFEENKKSDSKWTSSPSYDNDFREDTSKFGGAYFLNSDFTVRYRVRGHSDLFIKSWFEEFSTKQHVHELSKRAFDHFSNDGQGIGSCIKCHSVEVNDDLGRINWNVKSFTNKRFSKFRHQPHLGLAGDQGCMMCHKIDNGVEDYRDQFKSHDPKTFKSNFSNIDKSTCLECHQSESQDNGSCLTCHNYHVDGNSFIGNLK